MERLHKWSYIQHYGKKLQRLVIDGGFSCPNRDGSISRGGCTFCDNAAFHPSYTAGKSITEQIDAGMAFHADKCSADCGYLAYFQAYSGTYAELETLRTRYEEALSHPGIEGLVIGTRPDCVDEQKLDYLASLQSQGAIVELEFGIESVYDQTLRRINRGHDFETAGRAIRAAALRGLCVGAHLILGLPGETREMLVNTAAVLNELPLSLVKFHQLQILKGTAMEEEFRQHPEEFLRMDADQYVELLADIIERLSPEIAVARIASSVPPRFTDSPWGLLRPEALMTKLEQTLEQRGTYQGWWVPDDYCP